MRASVAVRPSPACLHTAFANPEIAKDGTPVRSACKRPKYTAQNGTDLPYDGWCVSGLGGQDAKSTVVGCVWFDGL